MWNKDSKKIRSNSGTKFVPFKLYLVHRRSLEKIRQTFDTFPVLEPKKKYRTEKKVIPQSNSSEKEKHSMQRQLYLFLLVLDSELEPGQAGLLGLVLEERGRILVVVVQDDLELLGGARLGEERARVLLTLLAHLLVLALELVLDARQPLQLPAEAEGGQDGVLARERHERGARERPIRVDARLGVAQAVLGARRRALHTAAARVVLCERVFRECWL